MKIKNFIFMLFLTIGNAENCPEDCACFSEYVSCEQAKAVPKDLQVSQTSLALPNHRITAISKDDFDGYGRILEQLSISNGSLSSIANGTFAEMKSLSSLDLHNTRITSINANTFLGMKNLTSLDLSGTHLVVLEQRPFFDLESLRILNLKENHNLLKVSSDAFTGLTNLDELFLGSSELSMLSIRALTELNSTTHIVFEDFPFPSLNVESFPMMPSLERLCIDRWKNLRAIGHFTASTPNLTELSITSSDLQKIPVEALNSDKLKVLKLDDNPGITLLRLHDFDGVRNVQELSLSNTGLATIHEAPFHDNLRLVSLDLSRNHLHNLPVHTLFRLFELERLNISHNNFTTLRPNAFENTRLLKEIDLTDNQISCDCDMQWLKNWHTFNIRERHIYGNCDAPRTHKGTSIAGIDAKHFVCTTPHFEEHGVTMELSMNKSSTIDCIPDGGAPDPSVAWSDSQARNIPSIDDVTELTSSAGMWQLANGSLHIKSMQPSFDGIYRCTATNKEGSSIKTYNLKTKSLLEPIEIPKDGSTSTVAIVLIVIGLLLPVGGALWYVRRHAGYKSILENGEGMKWNSV